MTSLAEPDLGPSRPGATPGVAAHPVSRLRFAVAVTALATGGFAIGTTEFVTMGLLPQIAEGVDVTIPQAGHLISAYALGVVVGAPALAALGARLPRRGLLVGLIASFGLLNLLSASMSHYGLLAFVRFLDGHLFGFRRRIRLVGHDLFVRARGSQRLQSRREDLLLGCLADPAEVGEFALLGKRDKFFDRTNLELLVHQRGALSSHVLDL